MAEAIDYVQGCLTIARTEFIRDNPNAAVVEMRKAVKRLGEAIKEEQAA